MAWAFAATASGCAPSPPAILLISVDTLRSDSLSLRDPGSGASPNLRALAEQGAVCERAYAVSATTAPSHASLFTGVPPLVHGVIKNGLALDSRGTTLAEQLRDRGYQTAGVVSSFVLHSKFGFDRGFDVFTDSFDAATSSMDPEKWEGHHVAGAFDRRGDATTRIASRWLREGRQPGRPFLLFVHYFDPHAPYDPPAPFAARALEGGDGSLPDRVRRLYAGEVAFVDHQIGELLGVLEELGLEESTVVVVTSDHGEAFGEHGILRHGPHLYEEAVRIPLLFRWPGEIEAGISIEGAVSLVDLVPTLLEIVGASDLAPDGHGRSLAGVLRRGSPLSEHWPIYLQRRHYVGGAIQGLPVRGEKFAIRLGHWKYIEGPEEGTRELYDLEADPGEKINAIYTAKIRAASMRDRLDGWRERNAHPRAVPDLSDEDLSPLRALGYIE